MSNMSSFFDELVNAKQAMERLPAVEAELARAQGEVHVVRSRLDDAFIRESDLAAQIETLKAALAQVQGERDAATFRQSETADKLAVLVGTFKAVNREINETVELVAPEPKPAATEIVSNIEHTDIGGEGPYIFNPAEPDPIADNPAPVYNIPGNFVQGQGFEPIQEAPPIDIGFVHDKAGYSAGTFKPSEETPQSTSAPVVDTTSQSVSATPDPTPYAGRRYWHKPDSVTWREWMAGGGDKAYWVDANGNSTRLDP